MIKHIIRLVSNVTFPAHVQYADVRKKLPVDNGTVKGIYNSHMLMQLTPVEMDKALLNMHRALQKGGILRIVVPDLKAVIEGYLWRAEEKRTDASDFFNRATVMALEQRPKGIKKLLEAAFGFSRNAWLMDEVYLRHKLEKAGFNSIRNMKFNDAKDPMFNLVERQDRFSGAICLEATK